MDNQPINRKDDPRWSVLGAYVRDIADQMGLSRWWINISHDPPKSDESYAETWCPYRTIETTICFGDSFFQRTPEQQRWTVIHELIHLLDAEREGLIDETILDSDWMTKREQSMFAAAYARASERFTDLMAGLLASKYPLPVWSEAGTEGAIGY